MAGIFLAFQGCCEKVRPDEKGIATASHYVAGVIS